MGEAKQPGPPMREHWGARRPWGQERRQPGQAPQAQQAWGGSQPYQKWHQTATNRYSKDANGWTTVRGTATTSTRTPSYSPRKRTQYDSHPSSISRPPVGGIATKQQTYYTHPNNRVCWYGISCRRENCLYQHPNVGREPNDKACWHGSNCMRHECPYWHPIIERKGKCWYGYRCTKEGCPYWHPVHARSAGHLQSGTMTPDWPPPALPARQCKFGRECWWKDKGCQFFHPAETRGGRQTPQGWEPHQRGKAKGKGQKGAQQFRFQEDARGRGGGPWKPLHSEPAPLVVQWPRSGRGRPTVTTQSTSWKGNGKGKGAQQWQTNDSKRKYPVPVRMGSDNYWEPLRYVGQKRNFALGQNQASHSATKGGDNFPG